MFVRVLGVMIVQHEHWHDPLGVARGPRESGVVRDTEVAAKPVEDGARAAQGEPGGKIRSMACAVVEDRLELAVHEQPVDDASEEAEGKGVDDVVVHVDGAAAFASFVRGETVSVRPRRVGPALLDVLELFGRAPARDARDPAQRHG
jgi:hypothetical protein